MDKRWPDWPPKPNISYTGRKKFSECMRSWFFQYYNSMITDEDLKESIFRQSKLMPAEALAGKVVDDAITFALFHLKHKGMLPERLEDIAMRILTEYGKFTLRWKRAILGGQRIFDNNLQPVDRLFFDDPYSAEEKSALKDKIRLCIANFVNSDVLEEIRSYPVESWKIPPQKECKPLPDALMREIDPLFETPRDFPAIPWFQMQDIPIYASYDFMVVTPDFAMIIDWKTGDKNRGWTFAVEQLHYYVAYVLEEYHVPSENISLQAVWLSQNAEKQIIFLNSEQLSQMKLRWEQDYKRFKQLLSDLRYGGDWRKQFPITETFYVCVRCPFRACEGYGRKSDVNLDESPSNANAESLE